jgi:DNA repair exonuclease SbcCD ATPase subunit
MNQALSQKKETTDTDKSKFVASILASVNRNQSTTDTSTTQELIQKYNITRQSDPKKIGAILAEQSVNRMLSNFIKDGEVREGNGKYYYGGKEFTPKQMKEAILKSFKSDIQAIIDKRLENIKLELKKQEINVKIQAIDEQKVIIANNIASLKNQLKIQEEVVEKRTEQYLNALYKQNKAQTEQRKEKAQLEANRANQIFQQDTLSGKDKQLTQGYQNQQIQLNQQRIQIDQAKQQADQHIQNLQARYESDLQKQKQFEQQQKLTQQQHNQIIQQQNDIAARNDQNIKNQIDAAKANNDALIAANSKLMQSQINANAQNTQAQIDANARNTQSVIQNANVATKATLQALESLGAQINGISTNFANMNQQFNALNTNMQNIGNKINNPPRLPPPPPGMPPGCAGSKKPAGCQADSSNPWNLNPIYRNATNKSTGRTGIEIYQCNAEGHFCSSDGHQGIWDQVEDLYYVY